MCYPVMTEKHLADRWQVSLKTLRRWRLDSEGPVWHKIFRHVRYHEADVLDLERRGAQHLMTLLRIDLGQASKMSRLAHLAPDLIEAIALGRFELGVSQLLRGKFRRLGSAT